MSTPTTWTPFERDVINMLLDGDHPALATLRSQFESATSFNREFTGAGFYVNFSVPGAAPQLDHRTSFELINVGAKVPGLERGIGFVLFVRSGKLDWLEGFNFDEDWPESLEGYELAYSPPDRPHDRDELSKLQPKGS